MVKIRRETNPMQVALFSATYTDDLRAWFEEYFGKGIETLVESKELSVEGLHHLIIKCEMKEKLSTLKAM